MAGGTRPDILTDDEYERMMALLLSSGKGRIFLAEYAGQARAEDTRALFAALATIQSSLALVREQLKPAALAAELRRVAEALDEARDSNAPHAAARARAEITALADALARGAAPDGQEG